MTSGGDLPPEAARAWRDNDDPRGAKDFTCRCRGDESSIRHDLVHPVRAQAAPPTTGKRAAPLPRHYDAIAAWFTGVENKQGAPTVIGGRARRNFAIARTRTGTPPSMSTCRPKRAGDGELPASRRRALSSNLGERRRRRRRGGQVRPPAQQVVIIEHAEAPWLAEGEPRATTRRWAARDLDLRLRASSR